MHIYRMSEWEGPTGYWYVNDIEELATDASKWYTAVNMLGITPCEYVTMLKEKFNAQTCHFSSSNNVLTFSFSSQADARKFKNWMNAQARKKNFLCGK